MKKITSLPVYSVEDEMPYPYDWVFVFQEDPEGDCLVSQIAKHTPDGWKFFYTSVKYLNGPSRADMFDIIHLDKITHWVPIPWDLEAEE